MFFYLAIVIYLLLFFLVNEVREGIISFRENLIFITHGNNYIWALLIAFIICLLGSASIGIPIPFPFVLFTLSNSVKIKYLNKGLMMEQILISSEFWLEIMGIAIIGGLGCIIGEYTSFFLGKETRKIAEKGDFQSLKNIKGFGRLFLNNPKKIKLYTFLMAATPFPDDLIMFSVSLYNPKFKFRSILLYGWMGKTVTTTFYCTLGILIDLGLEIFEIETNIVSNIVSEAIMLLVTITIMFFILGFDWNKYIENKYREKSNDNFN